MKRHDKDNGGIHLTHRNSLKKILLILFFLIVISALAGYFLVRNISNRSLPDYSSNIKVPGLNSEVTVIRDSFAIPHIFAKNDQDLYRAVGFVMAQDRLWQMDLLRRITQGRLSEILGSDQLETDLLMRSLRIREKSEKVLSVSSPEIVSALKAFSDGVNYYIRNYYLPPEFKILGYKPEYWKPLHSINLIGYMSWNLTSGWDTELLLHNLKKEVSNNHIEHILPEMENHPSAVYPAFQSPAGSISETILSANQKLEKLGAEIFSGSNNWAVSGGKSKTGKPLFANDMHLNIFAPGIWYQMHQAAEGSVNVTGVVLPGQPFVICGHNDSIAWGMTNVYTDNLDFYAETLNEDSTCYLLNGEWEKLLIKKEKIITKENGEITKTLKFTHRGPIINLSGRQEETALSFHWTGNEMSNEMRTIYLLNRAGNWTDFRDAVKTFISISQNINYADLAGNIGIQCCAGVPLREGSAINIFPGDTTRYDWKGFVPFEELPYEFNPERGYVSSANNKTVPEGYPYYIGYWYDMPNRIDRIREILEANEKIGIDDFCSMQSDFKSKKAEKMVPIFLEALSSEKSWNKTQQQALRRLQNWDFIMSGESRAASIFELLHIKLGENLIKDELSDSLLKAMTGKRIMIENLVRNIIYKKNSPWIDDISTPEIEAFEDLIKRSFRETVDELSKREGSDPGEWNWEKLHKFTIGHPLGVVGVLEKVLNLNRGPYGVPGSYHTVCPYSYSYDSLFIVNHGASHRHIYDLANWDASKTVIPTGTSGIPTSDYYLDQTEKYLNNKYHADPFSRSPVMRKAKYQMTLRP